MLNVVGKKELFLMTCLGASMERELMRSDVFIGHNGLRDGLIIATPSQATGVLSEAMVSISIAEGQCVAPTERWATSGQVMDNVPIVMLQVIVESSGVRKD